MSAEYMGFTCMVNPGPSCWPITVKQQGEFFTNAHDLDHALEQIETHMRRRREEGQTQ